MRNGVRFGKIAMAAAALSAVLAGCGGSGGSSSSGSGIDIGGNTGKTSLIAGSGTAGNADGPVATATFHTPVGAEIDSDGNIYISDYNNNSVRKISPGGIVSTLTTWADKSRPHGIHILTLSGQLLVATENATGPGGRLWRVDKKTGARTLWQELPGFVRGIQGLSTGNPAFTVFNRHTLQLIDIADDKIKTSAGKADTPGFADEALLASRLNKPAGMAVAKDGTIVFVDFGNHAIRRIDGTGKVSTITGFGGEGFTNGGLSKAKFRRPTDIEVGPDGAMYVADAGNHVIRRIKNGQVITIAGNGFAGYAEGKGITAIFYLPESLRISRDGKYLIVTDADGSSGQPYHRIRKVML